MNNTDRIRELERESSNLVARADNLQRDIERAEGKSESAIRSLQDLDKRFAVIAEKVEQLEKGWKNSGRSDGRFGRSS